MKNAKKHRWLAVLSLIGVLLAACSFPGTTNPSANSFAAAQATQGVVDLASLKLEVQADTPSPISAEGQVVRINYLIKNTGTAALTGNLTVSGGTVTCPALNTVGNFDNNLDPKETIICTSDYAVTKADMDIGSFKITATASINGVSSKETSLVVPIKVLTLTKTADPAIFDHAGQQVTYTYVIRNSGAIPIGPTQFAISDPSIGTNLFACGDANTRLDPGATVTCKATYTITQADMDAGNVTSNANALASGVEPSPSTSVTLTKSGVAANPTTSPNQSNLTPGSTIQYKVVGGEWMWQIARCFGVDPQKLIQANTQIANPAEISPDMIISVPNIGSAGTLYGPPCVVLYKVQSGDTWESIASQYNADVALLKMVNKGVLSGQIKVPRNSAGALAAK